jgi:hypothetical protein
MSHRAFPSRRTKSSERKAHAALSLGSEPHSELVPWQKHEENLPILGICFWRGLAVRITEIKVIQMRLFLN